MAKIFVFGIGGTGERVMRSLTMLMASGAQAFDGHEVYPIIIDYDQNNADKDRTVRLLQNYMEIHNAAFKRHSASSDIKGQVGQFFAAHLRNLNGLENFVFPFKPASEHEKFRDYIGYGQLAGDTLNTLRLLDSLYDKSNRSDTELNLDMTVGFKGNPNIGSVVFHTISDTPEFRTFTSLYDPTSDDKVIVIGSLFGGTGASGIPEIVKAVRSKQAGAKIATILVMPYFAPIEQKDGAIKASRFNSKTKAALSYYKDSGLMDQIDKVYYVGDPTPTSVAYSEGGSTQHNNANLIELISALMIEHFVSMDLSKNKDKEFKFSLDANIVAITGKKVSERLFLKDFDEVSIKRALVPMVTLAIGLKIHHDEIQTNNAQEKDFYKYLSIGNKTETDELKTLREQLSYFYDKYQTWLKELDFEGQDNKLPGNSHRFGFLDMSRNYNDIILKEAVVDHETRNRSIFEIAQEWLAGADRSGNSISSDYLVTRLNYHIRDNANGNGHYDTRSNSLRVNHEPEWVYADILHASAKDGFASYK